MATAKRAVATSGQLTTWMIRVHHTVQSIYRSGYRVDGGGWWVVDSEYSCRCEWSLFYPVQIQDMEMKYRYLREGKEEEEEKKIELDRSMDGVNSRWTENGTAGSGASPPKCLQKPKRPPLDQPQPHSRTGGEREQLESVSVASYEVVLVP